MTLGVDLDLKLAGHIANCPYCGARLKYLGENGRGYNRLIGLVKLERIVAWKCPECGREEAR